MAILIILKNVSILFFDFEKRLSNMSNSFSHSRPVDSISEQPPNPVVAPNLNYQGKMQTLGSTKQPNGRDSSSFDRPSFLHSRSTSVCRDHGPLQNRSTGHRRLILRSNSVCRDQTHRAHDVRLNSVMTRSFTRSTPARRGNAPNVHANVFIAFSILK